MQANHARNEPGPSHSGCHPRLPQAGSLSVGSSGLAVALMKSLELKVPPPLVPGVYRITRNPMYVGLLFVLIAWATFLAAPLDDPQIGSVLIDAQREALA